jgi:hypothetical protein
MAITCVAAPKAGATREDLKKLAAAFLRLLRIPSLRLGIDAGILSDLLIGRRPVQTFAPLPAGIPFTIEAAALDRRGVVGTLREYLPVELVNDVLVESRSWDDVP